jgi:hypothetical protein
MGIFQRKQPNDVLFLMPVRLDNEKLPKRKIRMLYCDAAGKVYASVISRSVYELAQDSAAIMERSRKPFATLGLETRPGNFIPTTVEIGAREVWALEHILEHALKSGRLPDILKQYLKPIIKLGEASREAVLSEHKKRRRRVYLRATPRVLNRLTYYSENDIEFSMPIYKAEYSYPFIVLKHLPADEQTLYNVRRLLILDSDGDLAVMKVPSKLVNRIERERKERYKKNGENECALISKYPKGLTIYYMTISQSQKKALDTITRYFEETGHGRQPVSAAARTVLARARDRAASPVK